MWPQLIVIVVVVCAWVFKRHRRMTLLNRLGWPGPTPNFLSGHSSKLFRSENNVAEVGQWLEKYGDTVAYYIGSSPALVTKDEDLIKAVQIKDFQLFADRFIPIKGGGHPSPTTLSHLITTPDTNRWKEMRSILTPTFNSSKLRQMTSTVCEAVDDTVARFERLSKNGQAEFNVTPIFQSLTMDAICRVAFGIRSNCQKSEEVHPFVASSIRLLNPGSGFGMLLSLWFPEFLWIIYPARRVAQILKDVFITSPGKYLHSCMRQILEKRRTAKIDRRDMMDALMEARLTSENVNSAKVMTATMNEQTDNDLNGNRLKQETVRKSGKKLINSLSDDEIIGNAFVFMIAG